MGITKERPIDDVGPTVRDVPTDTAWLTISQAAIYLAETRQLRLPTSSGGLRRPTRVDVSYWIEQGWLAPVIREPRGNAISYWIARRALDEFDPAPPQRTTQEADAWLSPSEAADYLAHQRGLLIPTTTVPRKPGWRDVARWCDRGLIPGAEPIAAAGRRLWAIPRASLDAFVLPDTKRTRPPS